MIPMLLAVVMILAAMAGAVLHQIQIYFGTDMGYYQVWIWAAVGMAGVGMITVIVSHFMDIAKLKMKVQLEELIMIRNNPEIPMDQKVEIAAKAYCEIYFPPKKNTPEHIADMAKVFKAGCIWLANPQRETLPE